ncbi:MAG: nucleotidyl transferase AbiEii/AbiGii toxin family protein [Saccharofermentans sp.]|nr:nucleotidyl transferase AbiEii/AbiGii toxin family protein [Saccharofermentans sp.]
MRYVLSNLDNQIETALAEKLETILSRGIGNTRPRDFYDIYMLSSVGYETDTLRKAFIETSKHRCSYDKIQDFRIILENIVNDPCMNQRWASYQKQMPYAEGISFDDTIDVIQQMLFAL